jgi:hypothetical protein
LGKFVQELGNERTKLEWCMVVGLGLDVLEDVHQFSFVKDWSLNVHVEPGLGPRSRLGIVLIFRLKFRIRVTNQFAASRRQMLAAALVVVS